MWALPSGFFGSAVGLWGWFIPIVTRDNCLFFWSQCRILLHECVAIYSAGDAYLDSFEFGAVVYNSSGTVLGRSCLTCVPFHLVCPWEWGGWVMDMRNSAFLVPAEQFSRVQQLHPGRGGGPLWSPVLRLHVGAP